MPVEGETTTLDPGVEAPLLVEVQADVYFQPEGVPSGAETTAPTPRRLPPRHRLPRGPVVARLRWVGHRVADLAGVRGYVPA